MKLYFTKRAGNEYLNVKGYLIEEWGTQVAEAFQQKAIQQLELLKKFPEMGSLEVPEKGIRGIKLTKQIRIFYRIKGSRLIILNFFDVRQNPGRRGF